ncbi:MAG: hypothetical protein ABI972_21540 [Acidobacteriota bacterium]
MPEPKLSVVLATDTYATIRPVVDRFRQQSVRELLELVFVTPSAADFEASLEHREDFGAIKIVENSVDELSRARAAGVRASTAEYVFIGETHSYPHPQLAEALMQKFTGEWAIVMPAMTNGNPKTAVSWSGMLSDYGRWAEGLPEGEITYIPVYNAAFLRTALLALGDRLDFVFGRGEELAAAFRNAGYKFYFQPSVTMDHLNVSPYGHWLVQRFASGMMIAGNRSRGWPLWRRAFYVLASPMIPVVLWRRVFPGVRSSFRVSGWPVSTVLWITLGLTIRAFAEMLAYAGIPAAGSIRRNNEYELHKLAYTDLV